MGFSLIIFVMVFGGLFAWASIFLRWRLGVVLLVVYTPFTGLVVSAFAPSPVGNLMRDLLIIIPLYVAFLLMRNQNDRAAVPFGFVVFTIIFVALVIANSLFGRIGGSIVSLLGAKIWLFYLPLVPIGMAFLRSKDDALRIMRLFVVMGWVPCTVGLLMWIGAISFSYKESVEFLYGDFARNATQNFAAFKVGSSTIYRIPGTFQFAAQYSTFCIFMVFPLLIQLRLEVSRNWKLFGYLSLVLVVAAALTSGSRGMFLHLPFALLLIGALRFGFGRGNSSLIVFAFIIFGAVLISQFDQAAVIDYVAQLAEQNGRNLVIGGVESAIELGGFFGIGVGSGTVAARHVIDLSEFYRLGLYAAIENYYAKAWIEMGLLGFVTIISMFCYLTYSGLRAASRTIDASLRDSTLILVALVLFIAYISMRGWPLDQDPMAYYFWLMVGFMIRLPQLDAGYARNDGRMAMPGRVMAGSPTPSIARF